MNTLRALFFFDFSRCRGWLLAWWLCCLTLATMSVGLVVSGEMLFNGNGEGVTLSTAYLILLILVGLIFQSAHPGRRGSFFRVRPIRAGQVLLSRWCFAGLFLLLPLFLSQLVPLLLVDHSFAAVSAFAVHYWGLHLGAVSILAVLASVSKKMSSYLLRSFFGGAALLTVAEFMRRFSWRESNWFFVAYPEAGQLLWSLGICLLALLFFVAILGALYRGRGSRWLAVVGIIVGLVLAAAWKPVKFLTDVSQVEHAVSGHIVDVEALSFDVGRPNPNSGYIVQRNRGYTGNSTYMQSAPPYWGSDVEEFWFMRGRFEIEGLEPTLAYSARLLEARWVSEDGEVVPYEPPPGTHAVRNLGYTAPPPSVTTARMVELLGEPPSRPQYFHPVMGDTDVLLFGAWTSVYEHFKSIPGRLEMRVRIDFYQYHLSQRIPLSGAKVGESSRSSYRLQGLFSSGGELEARLLFFAPAKRWALPIDQRWGQVSRNWWLHDPESGQRAPALGIGTSGGSFLQGLSYRFLRPSFQESGSQWHLPDISQLDSLELIYIEPRYLGTSVVDVTTEDFCLVTKESIEMAERDER